MWLYSVAQREGLQTNPARPTTWLEIRESILMREETLVLGENPQRRLRSTDTQPTFNDRWGGRRDWGLSSPAWIPNNVLIYLLFISKQHSTWRCSWRSPRCLFSRRVIKAWIGKYLHFAFLIWSFRKSRNIRDLGDGRRAGSKYTIEVVLYIAD